MSFELMLGIGVAVGLLGAVGVGMYFRHSMNNVPNPVETTGEVMEVEIREVPNINPIDKLFGNNEDNGWKIYYHPVVRFRVEGAKMVRFRNRKGFKDSAAYQQGDQVKVIFNKENPLVARVVEDKPVKN